MSIFVSIIKNFIARFIQSSASKLFGGVIGGILVTLLFYKLWSSLGSEYLYMILGGVLVCALILAIIYLLWKNIQLNQSKKLEAALSETVQQKKQRQQQLKTAITSLKDKWQTAMETLKATKINIYDIPWVLLIGEPQSGKTTTLKRSGLDFPVGKDALSGAGGTVNCDWWFTNDAIVIDTAGRFTMPVDLAPDKEEWHSFLKLLAKYRPKCPINNVIVTIPATSFIDDNQDQIEEKAGKIRDKLIEITQVLGIKFPVYIMVSKSDLINGFTEFCASLSSIENTQILGWNVDTEAKPFNPNLFHHQFETLRHRFYKWSLRRLRDLPVGKEADQIFSFPTNFSTVKQPLESYLSIIFKEDKFHTPLFFRGCFFSSGLQEGQSIVKAIESGNISGAEQFSDSFSKSRPYFIYNFYKKVFLENGLINRMGNVSRKERKLKIAALCFAGIFSIVSIWYLWSGYTLLTRVFKPIRVSVEQAKQMVGTDKKDIFSHKASEIISLAKTIEDKRNRLAGQGVSYRFFRGKNNSVIRDMKNIEDAILLKGLFQPILEASALQIIKYPDQYKDKIQMTGNLSPGFGILVDAPSRLYSLKTDIQILKETSQWMDVEPNTVLNLLDQFPKGDVLALSHADPQKERIFIRQEISGLNRFWKTYPETNWELLKKKLIETMKQYRTMLNSREIQISGEKEFKHNALAFVSASEKLLTFGEADNVVLPAKLYEECQKDYLSLSNMLEQGKAQQEINFFKLTIQRHSGICKEMNNAILADLGNHPELLASLVTADGNIHPEFQSILEKVNGTLKFSPLFLEFHKEMVVQNPERIVGFLDAWDKEWHDKKVGFQKELSETITSLTASGWEKEKLAQVINTYLEGEIWDADLQAALMAISTVLDGNTLQQTALTRGMNLPDAARIKWLEEKFIIFSGINTWLIQKYPSRPDISQGTAKITEAMTRVYKDYLIFWDNTLNAYDPSRGITSVGSWSQYRRDVIKKRGIFLDPGSWPFNLFLENVTSSGLDNLKKILGEDRNDEVIRLEKEVSRTAYVYSMASGNLGALGSAQDRFYQCVDGLSETPSEALGNLEDGEMEAFKSLTSFRNRVDSGLGGGEILAARLEKIQNHGLSLLKSGYASGFSQGEKNLIGNWYGSFKRRYPFSSANEMEAWAKRNGDIVSVHHLTASGSDFYDFCFDENSGVDALDKKYGLRQAIKKHPKDRKYQFIKSAIDWMDFIYDQNKSPRLHDIKITISDDESAISKKYTVLKIRGLQQDGSRVLKLRFSGDRYKSGKGVWRIDQDIPVQFSVENEETRESAQIVLLENDFSFPAYLVRNGKRTRSSSTREWELPLLFFSEDSDQQAQRINLIVEWDAPLPGTISWGR
jgi:hypothetical protein